MNADNPSTLDQVYALAENAEWQHLCSYLEFLEGFGLILVLAPEQAGVDVCRRALRQHYAVSGRALLCLHLRPGEAPGTLGDHLLHDPLPENLGAVWVDAPDTENERDGASTRELWRLALSALNPRRNPLRRRLPVPLLFCGPMWLNEILQHAAADLWSVRDTIIRIEPTLHALPAGTLAEMKLDSAGGQPEGESGDPEETRHALVRLRKKEVPSAQRLEHHALEARLLRRLGSQLRRTYRWQEAEDALLEAEQLIEKNPRSLAELSLILFDLYFLYNDLAQIDRAEHYARKALNFANTHFGAEHPETLASRNNLANALRAQDKYTEAEAEHRAVIVSRERMLGAEHLDTLASRNNLAETLRHQGKYAEAEKENRERIAIEMRVLGAEHPDTLGSRNNLAIALYSQGKYTEAEAEHRAVLAIRERVLVAGHRDVLQSYNNLAIALESQGKNREALEFARRAEEGRRRVLGESHPDYFDAKRLREDFEKKSRKLS